MHRKAMFLILSFFLSSFSNDFASAQTLKIPYVSISGFQAPLYLGERAGLFKKNQLEAQLIYMPGGSLIVQTLLSGDVGVASLAPPSAVAAWVKGAELALVAGGIERALNVLMVNPKIKKPDDLKGKYQYFTEATMTKLHASGLNQPFHSLEDGVRGYIEELISAGL